MRAVLVLALAAACGKDASAPPPAPAPPPGPATPTDPLLRTVAQPVPPGPYRVTYDCGPTNQQRIDLRAKTRTTSGTPAPVIGNISDAMVAMVSDTVTHVLAGGPYRAEPGPCTLSIETADGAPVFSIEKSAHKEKDAVSDLVRVFVP